MQDNKIKVERFTAFVWSEIESKNVEIKFFLPMFKCFKDKYWVIKTTWKTFLSKNTEKNIILNISVWSTTKECSCDLLFGHCILSVLS